MDKKIETWSDITSIEDASGRGVVLVGLCNGNETLPDYLGTLRYSHEDALVLVHNKERHVVEVHKSRDSYFCTVKTWLSGHGLHLDVKLDGSGAHFTNGIHAYDSGSSGPIVYGVEGLITLLALTE